MEQHIRVRCNELTLQLKEKPLFIDLTSWPRFLQANMISAVGKKVRVVKGRQKGREGIVIAHWVNSDDCSGTYGSQLYSLETKHNNNNSIGIEITDCEFYEDSI